MSDIHTVLIMQFSVSRIHSRYAQYLLRVYLSKCVDKRQATAILKCCHLYALVFKMSNSLLLVINSVNLLSLNLSEGVRFSGRILKPPIVFAVVVSPPDEGYQSNDT